MTKRLGRRRARHDIIMELLQAAKGGEKKTRLVYKTGLSFELSEKYLHALNDSGFIVEKSGVWKTTDKGLHVIDAYEICLRLTREAEH